MLAVGCWLLAVFVHVTLRKDVKDRPAQTPNVVFVVALTSMSFRDLPLFNLVGYDRRPFKKRFP